MTLFRITLLLAALTLVSGCETVTSLEPVGENMVSINQQDWQGSWLVDEKGVIHTKVTNAERGELLLVLVDVASPEKEMFETYRVSIRQTGDHYYFNLEEQVEASRQFFFARFDREGDAIRVYYPSYEYYLNSMQSGKAPGTFNTETSSVVLGGSTGKINAFIESHPAGFAAQPSSTIRKIGE